MQNNDLNKLKKVLEKKVGYKNPPKHSQFKKGVSGNPAGRKKKIIAKSLFEAITISANEIKTIKSESGNSQKYSMLELLAKKTLQDAIQKDGPSRKFIMEHFLKTDFIFHYKTLEKQTERDIEYEQLENEVRDALLQKLESLVRKDEEML